jgi:hypothetical protein
MNPQGGSGCGRHVPDRGTHTRCSELPAMDSCRRCECRVTPLDEESACPGLCGWDRGQPPLTLPPRRRGDIRSIVGLPVGRSFLAAVMAVSTAVGILAAGSPVRGCIGRRSIVGNSTLLRVSEQRLSEMPALSASHSSLTRL